MLQPFERFLTPYIDHLMELGKPYLVSQTYHRINPALLQPHQKVILLSDYDDPGLAKIHFKAIRHDPYAAIIDLEKPVHKKKIEQMAATGSDYILFWAVVKSKKQLELKVNLRYKDSMRDYITRNTNWRIDRDTTIRPSVQLIFGELFIVIKHGKQVVRVKFEELENG
ncbi:MAG: hypothetical protein EOO02_12585 [Chitinophagaceae bacterium]|nr:MAG: hypothetical protein EOO02_12585 [Chitinophagaceae bacterium]